MRSPKTPAASRRDSLPRSSDFATPFLEDWERLSRSGRFDMKQLRAAMILLIANDPPLGPEWLDHPLKGEWADHRECHIGGNFLLICRASATSIVFVRAGTHADLFG